jgi:hypothetical protein
MTPSVDADRRARVVALLESNVRTELEVVNGMLELHLSEASIERLMEGVTSRLLYAFEVDWSPDWVRPGQAHSWVQDGVFFARCSVCLLDSPSTDSEASAQAWARTHAASH